MIRTAEFLTPFGHRMMLEFEREVKGSRSRRHYVWRTEGLPGYFTPQQIEFLDNMSRNWRDGRCDAKIRSTNSAVRDQLANDPVGGVGWNGKSKSLG